MTPLEHLLARLEGVRRSGAGYTARCPAHDDRSPSLSMCEGGDGRVLLRCFAGCSAREIVTALGLGMRDLFPMRDPALLHWPLPPSPRQRAAAERARLREELAAIHRERMRITRRAADSPALEADALDDLAALANRELAQLSEQAALDTEPRP